MKEHIQLLDTHVKYKGKKNMAMIDEWFHVIEYDGIDLAKGDDVYMGYAYSLEHTVDLFKVIELMRFAIKHKLLDYEETSRLLDHLTLMSNGIDEARIILSKAIDQE